MREERFSAAETNEFAYYAQPALMHEGVVKSKDGLNKHGYFQKDNEYMNHDFSSLTRAGFEPLG